jgi:NAD(P)-dependent dehydrogenase (short-subunit alcohol dehydrogenase family)
MASSISVYVTGADHGLGRSLACEFARQGHRVFAGVYRPECLKEQPFPISAITAVPLDIGSDESVAKAASLIRQQTGSLDILINSAGTLGDIAATVEDRIDFADILTTINVNALGALRVTNSVVDLLKQGVRKTIVNISSEAGSIATAGRKAWFGYCMSKAAMNMQSMICFNQLQQYGFRLRLLHPGYMKTYMHGKRNEDAHLEPDDVARRIYALVFSPEIESDRVLFTDTDGKPYPW